MDTGITDVQYLSDFSIFQSVSPAIVNRATGVLYINQSVWSTLPTESKLFILLHEAGHAALQTTSEIDADNWAFDQYAKMGYPLTKSIYALSRVLKFNKDEDFERVQKQLNRAAAYDYYTNHNERAKKMLLPYNSNNGQFFPSQSNAMKLYSKNKPLFSPADGDEGPQPYDYGTDDESEPGSKLGGWLENVGSGLGEIANAFGTVVKGVNDLKNPVGETVTPGYDQSGSGSKSWVWIVVALAAIIGVAITIYVVKSSKK